MKQKIRTTPDLSLDSPAHQESLNDEERFWKWNKNTIDEFKDLTDEEIRFKLRTSAFPYAVCFENWVHDFNISSGIRNANAFNAQCVYIIGNKRIDKRGCVGVQNYMDIVFLPTVDDFLELKKQYTIIGVDNIPGALPIDETEAIENSLFIFGSEGTGLTPAMQSMCDQIVYIKQFGSVRSLNASTASGIVMFDFINKWSRQPW